MWLRWQKAKKENIKQYIYLIIIVLFLDLSLINSITQVVQSWCAICNLSSHRFPLLTVWIEATYCISGESPFPELSAYSMWCWTLNLGTKTQNKIIHRDIDKGSDTGADADDMDYVRYFVGYVHGCMREWVFFFFFYFNHTNGQLIKRNNACHIGISVILYS